MIEIIFFSARIQSGHVREMAWAIFLRALQPFPLATMDRMIQLEVVSRQIVSCYRSRPLLRPSWTRLALVLVQLHTSFHLTIDFSVLPPPRLTILWSGALAFGHVELAVTTSIIIGSIPGVPAGSLLSSRAPDRYIRPVITFVILASGLKYVGVGTTALGWALVPPCLAPARSGWPMCGHGEC